MDQSDSYNKPTANPHKHHQPSNSELMASAKLLAGAAQSSMGNESNKIDKARVAGAAADLVEAASHYGKLEEKSYGKYVEKAETYLHQYGHSTTTTTTTDSSGNTAHKTTTTHTESHSGGGDGHSADSGSGYGDYLKMAQGFLKKN